VKIYVISDNHDTVSGLRLAGIEGCIINNKVDLISKLEELEKDPEIAIVLMTTVVVNLAPDYITNYKLTKSQPLLTEIPDRFGEVNLGEVIDSYISDAIGIKLKGD